MKKSLICLLVFFMGIAPALANSPFATEVVTSQGSFGNAPYDDPQAVLGKPAVATKPSQWGDGKFSMSNPPFSTGLGDEKLITTLNSGDSITVKFDHKVMDDPNNPYGVDFIVFGNAMFVLGGDTFSGGVFSEDVTVSVSQDGETWYVYENGPFADGLFPTQPYQWDTEAGEMSDAGMDFTRPVNPELTGEDFKGLTLAEGIEKYEGSGGGTGYDLAETGFKWIQYVKVESDGGEVDAFSDVAPAYPPAAGQDGSTAIKMDDSSIKAWATGYADVSYGEAVDASWQTPEKALGPAKGSSTDILCLGRGGSVVLTFDSPIANGDGADFAVFENSFNDTFLELGYVEVSSNGVDFVRFDVHSLTADPVGGFGAVEPTKICGFAGKYKQGYGTPFDLNDLKEKSAVADGTVDLDNITHVKIVDVIGDGSQTDADGNPIYDPYPTSGSAGFDLDAVAVLNADAEVVPFTMATFEDLTLDADSEWKGEDPDGAGTFSSFVSGGATFNNYFASEWKTWAGFAYSNRTDTSAEGVDGQFNAITGTGKNSDTYAVSYYTSYYGPDALPTVTFPEKTVVPGAYFTNNAYAYYSMMKGDSFAKKFGEKDWFKLTITGRNDADEETGTVEVLLAEGTEIVDEWIWQDLSSLGAVKSLSFVLSSSDVGDWGMNTPAYFCMDNLGAKKIIPRNTTIELAEGWNLISLNVDPENSAVEAVLASIADSVTTVWGMDDDETGYLVYDPANFDPASPDDGDLTTLEAGKSYWFNMKSAATLKVAGSEPMEKEISLKAGINFKGFIGKEKMAVEDAFASVLDQINSVWVYVEGTWKVYAPGFGASDLTELSPGQGCWINAKKDCKWSLED